MRLNINPNRMELIKLKKRLVLARRGHKLLKDKQDELMRNFMELFERVYKERFETEKEYSAIKKAHTLASSVMNQAEIFAATVWKKISIKFESVLKQLFNLRVPDYKIEITGEAIWWSPSYVPMELDDIFERFKNFLPRFVKLAGDEKTLRLLAEEIERTRRRVNALEYILIPNILETIKYISMRLSENERSDLVRLMKVKEIVRSH